MGSVMLAAYRRAREWTQEQAADYFGVGYSLYCKLERGARRPSLTLAARIEERSAGEIPAVSWTKREPLELAEPKAS